MLTGCFSFIYKLFKDYTTNCLIKIILSLQKVIQIALPEEMTFELNYKLKSVKINFILFLPINETTFINKKYYFLSAALTEFKNTIQSCCLVIVLPFKGWYFSHSEFNNKRSENNGTWKKKTLHEKNAFLYLFIMFPFTVIFYLLLEIFFFLPNLFKLIIFVCI